MKKTLTTLFLAFLSSLAFCQDFPAANQTVITGSGGQIVSPSNFIWANGLIIGGSSSVPGIAITASNSKLLISGTPVISATSSVTGLTLSSSGGQIQLSGSVSVSGSSDSSVSASGIAIRGTPGLGAALSTVWEDLSTAMNSNNSDQISVAVGSDGTIYGADIYGNMTYGKGFIFKLTTSGSYSVLQEFASTSGTSSSPTGFYPDGIILDGSGNLWVSNSDGSGTTAHGAILKIPTSGSSSLIYAFGSSDGDTPLQLTLASDGYFYGVCTYGGANSNGTIFKLSASGSFAQLYDFASGTKGQPSTRLMELSGTLYGFTSRGVSSAGSNGGFYGISMTTGTVTAIHDFTSGEANSGVVAAALASGKFYCISKYGSGSNNSGMFFSITPAGSITRFPDFPTNMIQGVTNLEYVNGILIGSAAYGNTPNTNDGVSFLVSEDGGFSPIKIFDFYAGASIPGGIAATPDGGVVIGVSAGNVVTGSISKVTFGIKPQLMSRAVAAPLSGTSAGLPGQTATDGTNFYFSTGTNSWMRCTGTTW